MAAATKKKRKEEAYPWKAGASSRHITNLKQPILDTLDIYGSYPEQMQPPSNKFCCCKSIPVAFSIEEHIIDTNAGKQQS
jgi:hypothetical protein